MVKSRQGTEHGSTYLKSFNLSIEKGDKLQACPPLFLLIQFFLQLFFVDDSFDIQFKQCFNIHKLFIFILFFGDFPILQKLFKMSQSTHLIASLQYVWLYPTSMCGRICTLMLDVKGAKKIYTF